MSGNNDNKREDTLCDLEEKKLVASKLDILSRKHVYIAIVEKLSTVMSAL